MTMRGIVKLISELKNTDMCIFLVLKIANIYIAYSLVATIPASLFTSTEYPVALLVTAMLGILFFGERYSLKAYINMSLIIIALLVFTGFSYSEVSAYSIFLIVLNALTVALASYYNKNLVESVGHVSLVILQLLLSFFIFSIGVLFFTDKSRMFEAVDQWCIVIPLLLVAPLLALCTNVFSSKSFSKIGVNKTYGIKALTPILVVLVGVSIFDEALPIYKLVAVIVLVIAVIRFQHHTTISSKDKEVEHGKVARPFKWSRSQGKHSTGR